MSSKKQSSSKSKTKEDNVPATRALLKNITKRKVGYSAGGAIIITFLAYFGAQLVAGLALGIWANLSGQDPDVVVDNLSESTYLQFALMLLIGGTTLYVIRAFLRSRGNTFRDIGLARKPHARDILPALKTFALYFLVMLAVYALVGALTNIDTEQEQIIGFEDSRKEIAKLVLVFISLVIIPPVVEEILVRGFLYTGLLKKYKKVTSAIVASFLFGIAHLQLGSGAPPLWIAAIDTFVLSLFLIHLREKTGSLWSGIFVHAIKNGIAFVLIFVLNVRSF